LWLAAGSEVAVFGLFEFGSSCGGSRLDRPSLRLLAVCLLLLPRLNRFSVRTYRRESPLRFLRLKSRLVTLCLPLAEAFALTLSG
jgi:hypothetical protein